MGEYFTQLELSFPPPSVPWWLLTLAWIAPIGTVAASALWSVPRATGDSIAPTNASAIRTGTRPTWLRTGERDPVDKGASAAKGPVRPFQASV